MRDVPDDRLLAVALIENIQREDLNPIEEAQAYRRLVDAYGLTQDQIAESVGKDRSSVANTMRLLKLPRDPLAALGYEAIDDVPPETLAKQVLHVLEVCGATTEEELIRGVVYRLGLKRTTDRMQAIVGEVLDKLTHEGRVRRTPDARLNVVKNDHG